MVVLVLLEKINFAWDPLEASWQDKYQELIQYKRVKGNTNVSKRYPENTSLGLWVMRQRTAKKNGLLSEERIELLDEIGFIWDAQK